tara:strand:- start:464 stop:1021 length:558 start_codon:yes stop_codon:yes gene_type:complete
MTIKVELSQKELSFILTAMEHHVDKHEPDYSLDEINAFEKLYLRLLQSNDDLFAPEELDNDGIEDCDEIKDLDFYTHEDHEIDINMTCLQDEISVHYEDLVHAFGEPIKRGADAYKVDWEWYIEKDGVVATIYNYKNGPGYGYSGVGPSDIMEWHIGGHSKDAVEMIKSILLINGVRVSSTGYGV